MNNGCPHCKYRGIRFFLNSGMWRDILQERGRAVFYCPNCKELLPKDGGVASTEHIGVVLTIIAALAIFLVIAFIIASL